MFVSKVGNLEGDKMEMEVNKMFPTRPTEYKVIKEVKVSEGYGYARYIALEGEGA